MRILVAISLVFLAQAITATAASPPPGPCTASVYHQFDFWIGEWTVKNKKGNVVGADTVTKQLNGCVVYERYVDAGDKSVGIGLSGVQLGNNTWHQTFMDDGGVVVTLDGTFHAGMMELRGTNYPSGAPLMSDGIWIPHGDVVEEIWKVSMDGGRTWKVRFDGLFHRQIWRRKARPQGEYR
jgi:hypothetical protein